MNENAKMIESLIERLVDYGKTTYELVRLKLIDRASNIISTFIPHTVIIILFGSFLLFANLGLAFWLGEILGETYLGFLAVAAFNIFSALFVYLFLFRWMKKRIRNYIIKNLLK